jgi:hypothetical protein
MNVDNFVYIVDQTLKNLLYPNIIGILFWDRESINKIALISAQ